jgi:ribosomal protein RSM22 (predicted rRNA methylase)
MDYVFATYSELDPVCASRNIEVNTDDCVDCCKDSYYGGETQYKCDNSKKVYLIRNMATQIKQVDLALSQSLKEYIYSQNNLKTISLGGGPGTEAIAIMDILGGYDNKYELSFDNVDSESSWETMYEDLTQNFAKRISNVTLKTRFISSSIETHAKTAKVLYDIAFVSWLFSLIKKNQDIIGILNVLGSLLRENGYLVVADRFEPNVVAMISNAIENADGFILMENDRQIQWCGVMFPDELRDKFKVRLNADSAYWVLQKYSIEF